MPKAMAFSKSYDEWGRGGERDLDSASDNTNKGFAFVSPAPRRGIAANTCEDRHR